MIVGLGWGRPGRGNDNRLRSKLTFYRRKAPRCRREGTREGAGAEVGNIVLCGAMADLIAAGEGGDHGQASNQADPGATTGRGGVGMDRIALAEMEVDMNSASLRHGKADRLVFVGGPGTTHDETQP